VSEYYSDGDGVIDSRFTSWSSYDARGNLISDESAYDLDGDGVIDIRSTGTSTYDENGNLVMFVGQDEDGSGTVIGGVVWTHTN
jgi:nitrous oxidase accessory protein NosD